MLDNLLVEVLSFKNSKKAVNLSRFFKTGKGEYGEGDLFYGLTVPESRKIALKYNDLLLSDVKKLLTSRVHEERLIGLLILVSKYKKGDETMKKKIFDFYISNTKGINNWDLVDLTAPKIVGDYLLDKDKSILEKLARSENLWERRIAIIATFQFICLDRNYDATFKIANQLLSDKHDLIQKAVGWMLREVGKRISEERERVFLDAHYKNMGRTALRYAIERFPDELRLKYMKGDIK